MLQTLQNIGIQKKQKVIEEPQLLLQAQKKENEAEHVNAMNEVRTKEYDISRREIKFILDNANLTVRCEGIDKREGEIKRREEEIKRAEDRKR